VEALAKALAQALAPTKLVASSRPKTPQTLEALLEPRPLEGLMKCGGRVQGLGPGLGPDKIS
jgi:broad specificity phosphatase PhoE